jgi:hypothetical protein
MPGITLGFGESGPNDGFFGSLGRSISAATSPYREPGFVGGVRAFLNPATTNAIDDRQQKVAVLRQVWEKNQPLIDSAMQALHANNQQVASEIISKVAEDFQQNGIDPATSVLPILSLRSAGEDTARLRGMSTSDPQAYTRGLGQILSTPEQGMELGRSLDTMATGVAQRGEMGARTGLIGAQKAGVVQATDQSRQTFPAELEKGRLANDITQQAYDQGQVMNPLIARGRELLNAGQTTENKLNEGKLDYFNENQMLPGTASGAASNTMMEEEAKYTAAMQKMVQTLNAGKKGPGGRVDPYTPDEAAQMVAPINAYGANLSQRLGRQLPSLQIGQQPGAPGYKDPQTGEDIPAGPTRGVPRVNIPGQAQEQAQPQPFDEPLTQSTVKNKLSDQEIGQVQFDETTLTNRQKQTMLQIRKQAQAEISRAPAAQRQAILWKYNRMILEALAAQGGQ